MANDSGIGDWLGKLGLGSAAMAVLTWAAQVDLWILPLVAWLLALLIRVRGTHFALWPALNAPIDDLTKSGDLAAAFPGGAAQRRLRVLFTARGQGSRVAAAAQAVDRWLARWFGEATLSRIAFDRSLTFAFYYPIVLLLLVWLWSGQGRLGAVEVLPASWPLAKRVALISFGFVGFFAVIWPFRVYVRTSGWRRWFCFSLTMCASSAVIVITVALTAIAAFVATGTGADSGNLAKAVFSAVSLAIAFTVAGTLVGVVAVARASPVAGVVAVAGAVAGAGSVAFAPVGGGGVAVSGAAVAVGAFTGACVVFLALQYAQKNWEKLFKLPDTCGVVFWQFAAWLVILTIVAWGLPQRADMKLLSAGGPIFLVFFFLGVVPVWNASVDFASVALTRFFLRRYPRSSTGWRWMVPLDLLLAIGLTVLLFWGVLAALLLLQHAGWDVPADELVRQFRKDPTDPQVSWLTWMALTNVLPTLVHMGLACFGLWTGWLGQDEAFANALRLRREAIPASATLEAETVHPTQDWPLQLDAPLSKAQATKLVNWVYVDVWLVSLLPLALALSAWPAWRWLMAQALNWLPV
jgi:hypothetical protein